MTGHLVSTLLASAPATPPDNGDGGIRVGILLAVVVAVMIALGVLLSRFARFRGRRPGTGGFPAEPAPQTWHTERPDQ